VNRQHIPVAAAKVAAAGKNFGMGMKKLFMI
jgi:hypothetical protein